MHAPPAGCQARNGDTGAGTRHHRHHPGLDVL